MVSNAQLNIFDRYSGDLDMWCRTGKAREKAVISSEDWHLIDALIADSKVIHNRLGSPERTYRAHQRLRENCENEEVVRRIMELARRF